MTKHLGQGVMLMLVAAVLHDWNYHGSFRKGFAHLCNEHYIKVQCGIYHVGI